MHSFALNYIDFYRKNTLLQKHITSEKSENWVKPSVHFWGEENKNQVYNLKHSVPNFKFYNMA